MISIRHFHTSPLILVEFDIKELQVMTLRNYVFRVNRCHESHTLLPQGGAKKNFATFYVFFLPIWVKFSTGDVHKNYLCDCEFCEKRRSESRRVVNLFLSYFPHLFSGLC